MMQGREVTLPVDVIFPLPRQEASVNEHEYVSMLREKMEECFNIARKQLYAASLRQKRDYDSRIVEIIYKSGDVVYKKCAPAKKLEKKKHGMGRTLFLKCYLLLSISFRVAERHLSLTMTG